MCNYIAIAFFTILILSSVIINAESGDSKTQCTPNFMISCSHGCCKKKLLYLQDFWKNYSKYTNILDKYKQTEEGKNHDIEYHNADNMNKSESMPMSFQFSTHTIILFKSWETLSAMSYYLSLLICFIFGIISVMLKVLRLNIEESLSKTTENNVFKSKELLKNNSIRMIVSFIIYSWDYLLMLIVMTFNVGLFLTVILGLASGFFIFGNRFITSKKCKNSLDAHKEFHGDPACCGC